MEGNEEFTSMENDSRDSPTRDDDVTTFIPSQQFKSFHEPFVEKHCQLESYNNDDNQSTIWWPFEGNKDAWMTRVPFFLLIGAKQGGTTLLSKWLSQNPKIVPPSRKELLYFLPASQDKNILLDMKTKKYLVHQMRADLYSTNNTYHSVDSVKADDSLISFEATPGYLLFSTLARIPILCTMPWVKLLVTLRNPIDRVFSNYNFLLDVSTKRKIESHLPPLDDFILHDIEQLQRAGVLGNNTKDGGFEHQDPSFYGSPEERQAWTKYQTLLEHNEGPVGRSLYILQFQEWYDALVEIGRDPEADILVVRSEDMQANPDDVYQTILWWLELPSYTLPEYKSSMVTKYRTSPLSKEMNNTLERLFEPYNKRLFQLLGWDSDTWETLHFQEKAAALEEEVRLEDEEEAIEANMSPTELQHVYDPPKHDVTKGRRFTDQWCVLDKVSWYPPPHKLWQLRAPYFILPGAKKSGTTSVASYLMQHPLIEEARTKELQFFRNKNFPIDFVTADNKVKVKEARSHLYTFDFHSDVLKQNHSLMSFDGTPGYLCGGVIMAHRILCVMPWIKLVIVLRNPVDRAYSNWAFTMWRNNVNRWVPFETIIDRDLTFLNKTGVLDAFGNPQQEDEAWEKYRSFPHEGCIGRSLYDIQLRQWFQAFKAVGRDPRANVHILRTEDLKRDLQGTMKKVHKFLGLPHVPVLKETALVVSNYSVPMKKETRKQMEAFYDPYNQRLYKLLAEYGFDDDWNGFWDPQ